MPLLRETVKKAMLYDACGAECESQSVFCVDLSVNEIFIIAACQPFHYDFHWSVRTNNSAFSSETVCKVLNKNIVFCATLYC